MRPAAEIAALKEPPQVLLVLNKIDLIPPDLVPERREQFSKLMAFTDVVQISALTAPGREQLLEKVIDMLPEGPRYFPEDQITDIY